MGWELLVVFFFFCGFILTQLNIDMVTLKPEFSSCCLERELLDYFLEYFISLGVLPSFFIVALIFLCLTSIKLYLVLRLAICLQITSFLSLSLTFLLPYFKYFYSPISLSTFALPLSLCNDYFPSLIPASHLLRSKAFRPLSS